MLTDSDAGYSADTAGVNCAALAAGKCHTTMPTNTL